MKDKECRVFFPDKSRFYKNEIVSFDQVMTVGRKIDPKMLKSMIPKSTADKFRGYRLRPNDI